MFPKYMVHRKVYVCAINITYSRIRNAPRDWFSVCLILIDVTEDGGSMFLRNVGIYLQVDTALLSTIPTSIVFD
jgi:hypothetical protein